MWLSLLCGTSYSAGEGCSGCSRHSRLPGALCRRCWGSDRALFPCSGSDAVSLLFLPPQLPPSGRHCVGLDEPTCTPKDYDSLTDDALHQLRWRRGYSALRPRSSTMETLDRKRACGTQDAVCCLCVCVSVMLMVNAIASRNFAVPSRWKRSMPNAGLRASLSP